jgi:phosphatidylserine/phosphatidylglycerophosphate/cardiolipin synthase-like enzyme
MINYWNGPEEIGMELIHSELTGDNLGGQLLLPLLLLLYSRRITAVTGGSGTRARCRAGMPSRARASRRTVTGWPLLVGNAVEMLIDGDETYPAMIDAIRSACSSISLMSYIFEATGGGGELVDVLVEAREWGVEVQVLIDDAGTRYARP